MLRISSGLLIAATLAAVFASSAAPAQTFVNPANGHTYFTYNPTLTLAQITPPSAPVGAIITVSGAGFQPGATVTVGGAAATITGQSPQLYLLCAAPPGVIGVAPVVITSPGGCTATTTYTYH